jgi:hypothetical protein
MRGMGGVGEGEGRGRSRRLGSRYPVGSQIEAWEWEREWLMAVFISLFYREVMIHKKPLLCTTSTGPFPITDQRRHNMKGKSVFEKGV